MKIRGRLIIFVIQLIILICATFLATHKLISGENWFIAGLFSVIINPQLLEPFYPRPADVFGNCLISLFLCLLAQKGIMGVGWTIFTIILIIFIILSLITIIFGSLSSQPKLYSLSKAAKTITKEATALRIYSIVFWLSLIDKYPSFTTPLWIICSSWLLIVFINIVDWNRAWNSINGFIGDGIVEGMIGPSTLLVSAPEIPNPGKTVELESKNLSSNGIITSRIRRSDDVWGQIRLSSQSDCEKFIVSKNISIRDSKIENLVLGSVEENSTDNQIYFYPTKSLEIGDVVSVIDGSQEIMYQLESVKINQTDIKGGAHFRTIAKATQIGVFNKDAIRVQAYRWVPCPGSPIVSNNLALEVDDAKIKPEWFTIGHILGTKVPIFFDTRIASEGHLLILGMTKMGKSTLADRLAKFLGSSSPVTIFDQTSEYTKKRGYPICNHGQLLAKTGVAVLEPDNPGILPTFAKVNFDKFITQARSEYQSGQTQPRVILFDEAHLFIPEPSGMGFGAPGREDAISLANQMMQIRKYGLSIIIISQRTAVVAKSAISQCENIIAFKYVDQTGLDYLESIIGSQVREIVPKLKQGEALVFGPAFSSDNPVAINVVSS